MSRVTLDLKQQQQETRHNKQKKNNKKREKKTRKTTNKQGQLWYKTDMSKCHISVSKNYLHL
jgi:hypothetical protein